MRKSLWLILLLVSVAVYAAPTVAPSPIGKWALFAYKRTGKSRMPTLLTVFADGRYESRTPNDG